MSADDSRLHALRDFERKLDVTFPPTMLAYFAGDAAPSYLQQPTLRDLIELKSLHPAVPLRVLPLFATSCGNFVGLYYPRERARPFVVCFDHEESILFPVRRTPDDLFKDPGRSSHDHPDNHDAYPPKDFGACGPLLIDPGDSQVAELELLKPFSLHYRALERGGDELCGPLFARFGSQDPRARIVADVIRTRGHLHERSRWIELASRLATAGHAGEAIQALENCHALHFIFNFYTDVGISPAAFTWVPIAEVFEKLDLLLIQAGDAFDRATCARQRSLVCSYLKERRGAR